MRSLSYFSESIFKSARVDVYNKTGVINFETASSTSNIGNNNIGIYLNKISSDIGSKRSGILPRQDTFIEEVIWWQTSDVSCNNAEFSSNNVAKLGARYVRRTLNNKFEYMTPMNQTMDIDLTQDTWNGNLKDVSANVPGIVPYFNINHLLKKE